MKLFKKNNDRYIYIFIYTSIYTHTSIYLYQDDMPVADNEIKGRLALVTGASGG